ncbi:MAG: ABC transporter ATP-binding protein [Actinobacteria bacterium]|nr:ABC transporter ATP-binding protein [Actinomycetota bacterium]
MSGSTRGAALGLTGLVKRYEDSVAVDDVSLEIPAGEFVTLLGPSGSGKTTTLNMIAGFTQADEGQIQLDGKAIDRVPAHKRNIGVVFQHYALFPHMTVEDNVAFPLKRRRMAKAERATRIDEVLDLVRMKDFVKRYPRQLSGGQQQRVALARALVFNPRLLLMDEPLGALDKKLREWLQLEFKRIHQELGITFVYVTHDQEEALVLSDRIAVFNHGKIEQVGTATELYERPETLFVAEFVGESNCFKGRYRRDGDLGIIASEQFELRGPAAHGGDDPNAVLVVRPERVNIRRDGISPSNGANILQGTVKQVIYLGSARKTEVVLSDGRELVVRESASVGTGPAAGQPVEVFWAPDDSVLLTGGASVGPDLDQLANEVK